MILYVQTFLFDPPVESFLSFLCFFFLFLSGLEDGLVNYIILLGWFWILIFVSFLILFNI